MRGLPDASVPYVKVHEYEGVPTVVSVQTTAPGVPPLSVETNTMPLDVKQLSLLPPNPPPMLPDEVLLELELLEELDDELLELELLEELDDELLAASSTTPDFTGSAWAMYEVSCTVWVAPVRSSHVTVTLACLQSTELEQAVIVQVRVKALLAPTPAAGESVFEPETG